jgi:hypothetical protein
LPTSQPNSRVTLLLDRTHQSKVAEKLLRDVDVSVEIHKRHYLRDAPDPDWIADASARGWAIISGDKGLELDGINRHAVVKNAARVFLLADTNSRGAEWAAALVAGRHRIIKIAGENRGPFYCKINKTSEQHVEKPEFLEGGGPLPRVHVEAVAASAPQSAEQPSAPTEENSQIKLFPTKE